MRTRGNVSECMGRCPADVYFLKLTRELQQLPDIVSGLKSKRKMSVYLLWLLVKGKHNRMMFGSVEAFSIDFIL